MIGCLLIGFACRLWSTSTVCMLCHSGSEMPFALSETSSGNSVRLNSFSPFRFFLCPGCIGASLFPFNKRLAFGAHCAPTGLHRFTRRPCLCMLPLFIFIFAPLLSLLPSISAHGYVSKVVIDGSTYNGNNPNAYNYNPTAKPSDSPIRLVSDIGPVKGSNNPSLNCGLNAQLATMVVPANPGSVMQFFWINPGGGNVCFPYFPQAATFA